MIIDWNKQGDKTEKSLLGWVILESLCCENGKQLMNDPNFDSTKLDVKMTVNGFETDLVRSFTQMESQFNQLVERKAKELIDGKLSELSGKIEEFRENIDTMLKKAFET